MIKNFDELIMRVKEARRGTAVIAAAQTESVLDAAILAKKEGLAESILVGDAKAIQELLQKMSPEHADSFEIVDTGSDLNAAARKSVELINSGKGDLILKGKTDTSMLLRAVLDKENGLRISDVISDVLAYEHPDGIKLMTDGGINILPELKEKIAIIKNAVQVAHYLGNTNPKVAVLTAVEVVNPKMPATLDAALLSKMNERGQIPGCTIEGPMAFDNAVDATAARLKGISSPVGGAADIMIVPNIEAGNFYGKMLTYYCKYRVAHIVMGTKAPILIPSRADDGETKMLCMALSLACIL
ncbi:MAG: bifunctional enoyl-CoA hydratase/phosphate acetyltransferase [Candidatus Cloacimonadaceae bacterium]|jgi:phosphate butyryltransferase|nr:bifunctional enoyl-CoA hydratase/phosphate acetyltransferase [Candidatus Cloacimonadota bacterium]MDY0127818.1 bifunctional enoyl-CoA hydratase/phosphate acetyltransferase [Candidatus Cloacimonadaceae bacterium]MCB5254856.1 bifunctional enoyl-CoA hydratase/phosphate acetyltransferase [Candidatus Cloacimonadota bacterium]MCK9177913.1 bifunctional enoyl-CoA hydratase/phosphate acetyltransferase [Candidatus Cloacimonadota bacterium]MCK9242339.1 bifunctional enoyl-CoA hydratase/phosphate acetylt